MPTIFEGIQQPLSIKRRTTRSQTRCLQNIKRVISSVDKDHDDFQHFSSISLNNRISNLTNSNTIYDPIAMNISNKFLANHNVCQQSSIISVTLNGKHDSNSLDSSMVAKRKRKKSPRKEPVTIVKDIEDRSSIDNNSSQPNTTAKTKSDEDDVIFVNPVDDSVIIIEDACTEPSSDSAKPLVSESPHKIKQSFTLPSYIPLVSHSHKCDPNQNKLTTNVPIINIVDEDMDEDKDIIFVKEEILNKKQRRRKKISSMKKAKKNQLKKRCVKCINVNAMLARNCPCKNVSETDNLKSGSVTSQNPKPRSFVNPWNVWNGVLQQTSSTNVGTVNVASNVFNINAINRTGLREIVIDGSNLALGHTNGRCFSVKGLQIAIDYFVKRGHKVVAFVPQYRQKYNQTTDTPLLKSLASKGYVVFTPSREVNGRRITPYDDRYIIQYAAACEGIVVSSDNYRDLFLERIEWRTTIERRLLMPTWVGDMLMFPEDPLGRHGPHLSEFLKFP
ncbi:hypothetical protein RI129_002370 [Pyrocoelia pectoralis]|uniref:RNase NYN domain-containing protein n=1 Tax=Pyrocoelia pectoralis TaxID=417401 RepID=A0AAN7VMK4_9COLE